MIRQEPTVACDSDRSCITCSDQGDLRRVISTGGDGVAVCTDAEGRATEVEVALVGGVAAGDVLLVHAGVALVRVGGPEKSLS